MQFVTSSYVVLTTSTMRAGSSKMLQYSKVFKMCAHNIPSFANLQQMQL
ncbi:hypothetical protein ACP70R_008194 [Stipagrostis hirtigluma subsp. patula]